MLTLNFGSMAASLSPSTHPGLLAGSIRLATEKIDGAVVGRPYEPHLLGWPQGLAYEWSPVERRASTTQIRCTVSTAAMLSDLVQDQGRDAIGLARLDLWTTGATFADVVPLVEGPFSLEVNDRATNPVTVTVTDGGRESALAVPAGKINVEEFPEAPSNVAGVAERQTIVGDAPARVPLHQIDESGRLFYFCDPPASYPPAYCEVEGVRLPFAFEHRILRTVSGVAFSALFFERPPSSFAAIGTLTATGGIGIATESAALSIIRDLGGYRVAPDAEHLFLHMPFVQSVYVGSPVDPIALVRDRVLPQTDAVFAWRRGYATVLRYDAPAGQITLGRGRGLLDRLPVQNPVTPAENVRNLFRISFGDDAAGGADATAMGETVTIAPETVTGPVADLLVASRQRYGVREMALSCPDLRSRAAAVRLGMSLARLLAFQHALHRYMAEDLEGLMVVENTRVLLNDATEGLVDEPTRVVGIEFTPAGTVLTMMTEDTRATQAVWTTL